MSIYDPQNMVAELVGGRVDLGFWPQMVAELVGGRVDLG